MLVCRCGHCKSLAPKYEIAATELLKADPPVPLAKMDCTENQGTCSQFGVSGYPTLKIFRGGEFSADYQGPRSEGVCICVFYCTDYYECTQMVLCRT